MDEDAAATRADGAQHRDHRAAFGDIGRNAGPHADAADQQRGQAHNGQEAHEQVIVAHHRPQAVAGRAHGPAALAQRLLQLGLGRLGIAFEQAQLVAEDGAQPRQRRGAVGNPGQAFDGDHRGQAETEAAHGGVGQSGQGAAHFEGRAAEVEHFADPDIELFEHQPADKGAGHATADLEEIMRGHVGRALRAADIAEQRVAGIDRDQVDKGVAIARLGPHIGVDHRGDAAIIAQHLELVEGGGAVGAAQFDVAAHDQGGIFVHGTANAGAHRADPGDERRADGETDDQQAKAAQIAAHVLEADEDGGAEGSHQCAEASVLVSTPAVMV